MSLGSSNLCSLDRGSSVIRGGPTRMSNEERFGRWPAHHSHARVHRDRNGPPCPSTRRTTPADLPPLDSDGWGRSPPGVWTRPRPTHNPCRPSLPDPACSGGWSRFWWSRSSLSGDADSSPQVVKLLKRLVDTGGDEPVTGLDFAPGAQVGADAAVAVLDGDDRTAGPLTDRRLLES